METGDKRQRHKKSVSEHPLCAWQSWKTLCTRRHDLQIRPLPVSWRVNFLGHFFSIGWSQKRKWHSFPIFFWHISLLNLEPLPIATAPTDQRINPWPSLLLLQFTRYLQPVQDLIRWGVKAKMSQSLTNFDWTQKALELRHSAESGLGMRHQA